MKLDLSQLFRVYAKRFEKELKAKIRSKIGIDGQTYSHLKEWAILAGRRTNSRLTHTGKFRDNAVTSEATDIGFKVQGNPNSYEGAVTFDDIISYNNRGSATVNRDIDQPPLIFPNTDEEVMMLQSYDEFTRDLEKTIEIQTGKTLQQFAGRTVVEVG